MPAHERVARVVHYPESHHAVQPDLATPAAQAGLSPFLENATRLTAPPPTEHSGA